MSKHDRLRPPALDRRAIQRALQVTETHFAISFPGIGDFVFDVGLEFVDGLRITMHVTDSRDATSQRRPQDLRVICAFRNMKTMDVDVGIDETR